MYKFNKGNKGFTIIELIAVIVVVAILLFIAIPKFKGPLYKVRLLNIKNDIKVAENLAISKLSMNDNLPNTWEDVDNDILKELQAEGKLYNIEGFVETIEDGEYKQIPKPIIGSKLQGEFYTNQEGIAYYAMENSLTTITPVKFEDVNLEKAVRNKLDIPKEEIFPEDMEELIEIRAENLNITNIVGLEHAKNLKHIYLKDNKIIDLSPLDSISTLINVELHNNRINNIDPLFKNKDITYLKLTNNNIANLTPLQDMKKMNILYLGDNNINNVDPLFNLKDITHLELQNNKISDISFVNAFDELSHLNVSENNLVDLSPISNLINLETLDISDNNVEDISSLYNLNKSTNVKINF